MRIQEEGSGDEHLEDDPVGALPELLQLEEVVQPVTRLAGRHGEASLSGTSPL